MNKVTLNDIKGLFGKIIIPFHTIIRDTTIPLNDHRADNDAEHSWSLALLAIALAPEIDDNLDVGKVSTYAVIHDLVEVYSGDTSVWSNATFKATKHQRELDAIRKLKKDFPSFPNLAKNIEDYEKRDSNEAKFVYALDKLLNLLNVTEDNGYYYLKNKITKEKYLAAMEEPARKTKSHDLVASYYNKLRQEFDSNPGHFYRYKK
jgi:putative hydrolase of HD superfamily